MTHRKKKIVATCMIVYMGTLALPQTPAHAHESEQTAVSQPAGEQASIHTDLNANFSESAQPDLEETVTPEVSTETPEGSEAEVDPGDDEEEVETKTESSEEGANTPEDAIEETVKPDVRPDDMMQIGGMNFLQAASQPIAVDPAHDLVIAVKDAITVQTPTTTGQYESGAAGTYEPGKDYAPDDDVVTGKNVIYDVAFSFGSMADTQYMIDKIEVVSVDENGSDLGLATPIYKNDGARTEQSAVLKDIKWGADSGFVTGGTAKMDLAVELPDAIYWDTQIAPQIKLVAYIGESVVESDIIDLPAVRLSSQAIMNHQFTQGDQQKVTYDQEKDIFTASFNFASNLKKQDDMIGLLDRPQYETQTYYFNVKAIMDKIDYAERLTEESFTVEPGQGMQLAEGQAIQYDAEKQLLAVTMQPSDGLAPQKYDTKIFVDLPHSWAGEGPHGMEHHVSIALTMPQENGVEFTDFVNAELFIQSYGSTWKTAGTLLCPNKQEAGDEEPYFTETIAAVDPALGTISHRVSLHSINLAEDGYITIYQVLPHRVAYLDQSGYVEQSVGGVASTLDNVEVLYGYEAKLRDFSGQNTGNKTNYKELQQLLQNGEVSLVTDPGQLGEGIYPNIRAYRFKAPELSAQQANEMIEYRIVGSRYDRLPEELMERQAASAWFEGRLISLVSLPVKNDEETYKALEAGLNADLDMLQAADGQLYLNLGAPWGNDDNVQRFQTISKPRSSAQIKKYSDMLTLSVVNNKGEVCRNIDRYNESYQLRLLKATYNQSDKGNTLWQKGTTLSWALPAELLPYLSVNEPYMVSDGQQISITEFTVDNAGHTLTLTLPEDLKLVQAGKDGIFVSLQFFQPTDTIQLKKGDLALEVKGAVELALDDPAKIMNGYVLEGAGQITDLKDNFVGIKYTTHDPFALLAGEKDSQTLQLIDSGIYANGEKVTFKGQVFNTTEAAHPYYAAFSVPTAGYNMAENGPDSVEKGYIRAIKAFDQNAEIYYQTAIKASADDLAMMKAVYGQGKPLNLETYYSTIQTQWQRYDENTLLPDDVIMFMVYLPNLASGEALQVSYDVQMDVAEKDENTYINNAVMKYYSGGTTMEIWSNRVTISNMAYDPEKPPAPPIDPDKPDVPDTPIVPDKPDVPDTPDTPNTPDIPDTPVIPDEPGGETVITPTPTPLAPKPEVTIEEETVPLAAQPEVTAETTPEEVTIEDETVPLAQLPNPHTGQQDGGFWAWLLAAIAGLGLSTTWLESRRKKDDQQ